MKATTGREEESEWAGRSSGAVSMEEACSDAARLRWTGRCLLGRGRKVQVSDPLLSSPTVSLGQTNETGTALGASAVAVASRPLWMCGWAGWHRGTGCGDLARAGSRSWLCFSSPHLLALSFHVPHNQVTLKFVLRDLWAFLAFSRVPLTSVWSQPSGCFGSRFPWFSSFA